MATTAIELLRIRNERETFSDADPAWRQFVLDHLTIIKNNSLLTSLNVSMVDVAKYNFIRLLRNSDIRLDIAWIILLVNQIPSDIEFLEVPSLYIPSNTYIASLHRVYLSSTNN